MKLWNWRREKKVERVVKQEAYRELQEAEVRQACQYGEGHMLSLLAVHTARTMRDEAVREVRNILRRQDLRTAPDVQAGMLVQAAARMDAAMEYEELWKGMMEHCASQEKANG